MHFHIEIQDGELWSTSNIGGVARVHGPGLEGVKLAYGAVMEARLSEGMNAIASQRASDLASRMFKARLSKSEQQLKLQLFGKLKVEIPPDQTIVFKTLLPDGTEVYAGSDLADAVKSLSSFTLPPTFSV